MLMFLTHFSQNAHTKKLFSIEKTVGIMQEGRGEFFAPDILDIFLNNIDNFLAIRDRLRDVSEDKVTLEAVL